VHIKSQHINNNNNNNN